MKAKKIYASILSAVLLTQTGCTESKNYEVGTIRREDLKEYKLVELKITEKPEIYIVNKEEYFIPDEGYYFRYIDVFSNKIMYDSKNNTEEIIEENNFNGYLLYYGDNKEAYTKEELKNMYEQIKEEYVYKNEKTITKNGE